MTFTLTRESGGNLWGVWAASAGAIMREVRIARRGSIVGPVGVGLRRARRGGAPGPRVGVGRVELDGAVEVSPGFVQTPHPGEHLAQAGLIAAPSLGAPPGFGDAGEELEDPERFAELARLDEAPDRNLGLERRRKPGRVPLRGQLPLEAAAHLPQPAGIGGGPTRRRVIGALSEAQMAIPPDPSGQLHLDRDRVGDHQVPESGGPDAADTPG